MNIAYSTYRLVNQDIGPTDNELRQVLTAGELTLYCTLIFDTDSASDTYNHWICTLDVVSDTLDVPERSIVLYPNTVHFVGDDLYVVSIVSDLESIGHDDLQNTFITIGVEADE